MVEVLIGDDGLILISKKAIEKSIIVKLNDRNFAKKYSSRIKAWLKDFHAEFEINEGTSEFRRSCDEVDINSIGLEYTMANLQQDHMKFLGFIESLINEDNNKSIEKPKDESGLYIYMKTTSDGIHVEGTLNPLFAITVLADLVDKHMSTNEENNEND